MTTITTVAASVVLVAGLDTPQVDIADQVRTAAPPAKSDKGWVYTLPTLALGRNGTEIHGSLMPTVHYLFGEDYRIMVLPADNGQVRVLFEAIEDEEEEGYAGTGRHSKLSGISSKF